MGEIALPGRRCTGWLLVYRVGSWWLSVYPVFAGVSGV